MGEITPELKERIDNVLMSPDENKWITYEKAKRVTNTHKRELGQEERIDVIDYIVDKLGL